MAGLSERALIRLIRDASVSAAPDLIRGIGDDCAVFGTTDAGQWLITTDTLVDLVHFDRHWHPPELLGRKSIAVNLSDIAAMGGVPRFVLLSLCLPSSLAPEWLQRWLSGVSAILAEQGCVLIGGDITEIDGDALAAEKLGRMPVPIKMDLIDQGIGGD